MWVMPLAPPPLKTRPTVWAHDGDRNPKSNSKHARFFPYPFKYHRPMFKSGFKYRH